MTTTHDVKADKERQVSEAEARRKAAEAAGATDERSPDPIEDQIEGGAADPDQTDVTEQEEAAPKPQLPRMSPGDEMRAQIAKRFSDDRNTEMTEFDGDNNRPSNLYGKAAARPAPPAPELDPDAPEPGVPEHTVEAVEPEPQPEPPRTHRLKVRHGELELTEDQLYEAARKGLAADSYLDDARDLHDQARTLRNQARPQDGVPRSPQSDHSPAPNADIGDDPDAASPQKPLKALVEKIQFGDPEEAEQELSQAIKVEAQAATKQALLQERFRDDLARNKAFLSEFQAADENVDVKADPLAQAVIERKVYDLYLEDIRNSQLLPEDKIPRHPAELADAHRWLRIHGVKLRTVPEIIQKATSDYRSWRGTPNGNTQQPAPRQAAPRVVVDRTARREAIPAQPARSASPKPDLPQASTDRMSDAVMKMRQARGQPVA